MGFGTWLKAVGQKIAQATGIAERVLPMAGSVAEAIWPSSTPMVDTFLNIVNAVIAVEGTVASIANSNATGPDKARAAGNLAAQAILASPIMRDKKVKDTAAFQKACSNIAGGVADLLNSISE